MCARYKTVSWWHHLTHLKFAHTSKWVWNIPYFRPFCIGLGPKEIVIAMTNSLIFLNKFCIIKNTLYKFLTSTHNLGFRILRFYHREQWRSAKTAGKKCWGSCHGLIPSLWDFAQNYSLQIELRHQNWRGTFYSFTRFREGNWAVHFEGGEGPVCWVQWQNCSLTAAQRNAQPLWNSHDGLNLRWLDQCHNICSHGTSSSQSWRNRIVVQSTVEISSTSLHTCFKPSWFMQVYLGKPSREKRQR